MSEFSFSHTWDGKAPTASAAEATFGALTLLIDRRSATVFASETEGDENHIQIPLYYLAEWIAENWWALLWEPRKAEDGTEDDADFLSRHSLLAAQRGFALPDVSFVSNGPYISIQSKARDVPFSDVRFKTNARVVVNRSDAAEELSKFVDSVSARLEDAGIRGTALQEAWSAVRETDQESQPYCQFVGALGLSPYAVYDRIDSLLEKVHSALGDALTLELCLVAKPQELEAQSRAAMLAVSSAHQKQPINLGRLSEVNAPVDILSTPGWQRGARAAKEVRRIYDLDAQDAKSATALFELLGIDTARVDNIGRADFQAEGAAITGAAFRNDAEHAQLSFIQRHEYQRRFTAARGLFAAWTTKVTSGHLLTQAVTRYQQASRAFAAELVAPLEYIRRRSDNFRLNMDEVDDIATELNVGVNVVRYQAQNNGIIMQNRRVDYYD